MSQPDLELYERSVLGEERTLGPLNKSSIAYGNSIVVKTGTGILYGFTVFSSKASAQWIQVFDARDVPADGAVPAWIGTVATVANLGANWIPGRTFYAGCVIVNSSTGPTKTIGSADCWFDVQYV